MCFSSVCSTDGVRRPGKSCGMVMDGFCLVLRVLLRQSLDAVRPGNPWVKWPVWRGQPTEAMGIPQEYC